MTTGLAATISCFDVIIHAMTLKEFIINAAQSVGFQRTVIASLASMEEERAQYERWLALGYAAGMEYLKRNPYFRTSPELLHPSGRSAIVVSVSYYTDVPQCPGSYYGRVARYAVGLDYHAVLRAKLRELKNIIEKEAGRSILAKAFTDDVALFEQGLAARHGLGFAGRNTLIIGPKLMGSYNFVGELVTDLQLEPDESYAGTCGQCFRCGAGCPTAAIKYGEGLDANLCISYLTIENKNGIPVALRKQLGSWVFGCDVCQEVCPYNQKPPPTPWAEFHPRKGAGHYLDLLSVLAISSEEEFRSKFGHTPLRRPKRRGLLRNALVVLGNRLAGDGQANGRLHTHSPSPDPDFVVRKLADFAACENDPMLREHAYWAIFQGGGMESKKSLGQLLRREPDEQVRACLSTYA
ncbi:MAG TPA: tRNA epoxyqueuosine(34) reductase QueG [Candidatus Obscuribacterales bacterium]